MKPGLQLKISQQLTMTPQLQQAIRLLQLSTLELQQEVVEQLYNNPLLEMDEEESAVSAAQPEQTEKPETPTESESDSEWSNEIPEDLPVDANWDDIYSPYTKTDSSSQFNLDQVYQVTESLQDHLQWQLNLTPFSATDRAIAEALIDAIDSNGFISHDLNEIISHITPADIEDVIDEDESIAVLHRLQQFDPPGIFARDIQECLLIQLNQLATNTPFINEAKQLVQRFLKDIAAIDIVRLARKTGFEEEQLKGATMLIRSLNPRPGESVATVRTDYIVPDVFVEKVKGRWKVTLNDNTVPRLRINEGYSNLIKRADNSADNLYLKNNLTEARWFLRSLESRNDTLMRVASTIANLQKGFLDHGPVAMQPMVLSDIADKLELHESTISRVTTNKYMATPQGIFELKYFFSSHVGTSSGGECSSTAVCAMLKEMISAENPSKPLSDNKLTSLLEEQGVHVARRTVAKYRESMGIPSSSQRKRFDNSK